MTEVSIKLGSITLEIEGYYDSGDPGVYTYSNGDPGYPPTDPSFTIDCIKFKGLDISDVIDSMNDVAMLLLKRQDSKVYEDIWMHLEELVLKELNSNY